MANYNKDTKFYWLQLKEDFFENDAIEWLEEQKPNGRDYAYFYLKLCLKSLKSNGILIRKVGSILIPYDNKKLAELTKMDFDTVTVAMELLKKIGLIEILENGEIYVTQLEQLIGSKSMGAYKKQQQRLLNRQEVDNCPPTSGQDVEKCPPKIELELELEQKIEIEQELDADIELEQKTEQKSEEVAELQDDKISKITRCYEDNIGMLTPASAELLFSYLKDFQDYQIILEAIKKSAIAGVPNAKYVNGILRKWKAKGFKVLADLQKEQKTVNQQISDNESEQEQNERKIKALQEAIRGGNCGVYKCD